MQQSNRRKSDHEVEENVFKDILLTVTHYKWSILITAFLALLLAFYVLYFKMNIYRSSALIEVKSSVSKGGVSGGDFLSSAFSGFGSSNVDKDIEILKTFHVNNIVLQKVDFHTRYYVNKGFKQVELYDTIPIKIKNLTILNHEIEGYKIKISPVANGFTLQIDNTIKNTIQHALFNKEITILDDEKVYPFGQHIETPYFTCSIEKNETFEEELYFVFNTDNRSIFEGLKGNLVIGQINPDAPLIEIAFTDTMPSRANSYVNALAESFIEQSIAEKSKGNNRIISFIEKQLLDIKLKLNDSEEKLEKYRIQYQAIEPSLQAKTYITELSKIDIELSQNELKQLLIDNLITFAKEKKDLDSIAPFLMELKDRSTTDLISKLQEAQISEEGLRAQFSSKHPGFIAVRKQISYIKKKLILNIKNLKLSISHRNKNLLKLKKDYETKLKSMPTKERTLVNLQRDYQVSSETYKYLLRKKSENEMIKVAVLSDYRIVDYAYNNYTPIAPKRKLFLLVFLMLGLVLGISQAFLRNFLNDKIQGKNDIENRTRLPIYGIIPALKQKEVKLEVYKDPKSPFAESFRSLRTNLQFTHTDNKTGNVILITSTIAGEGKTTTVANLSAIFQMANYKCIVINLDMRKPALHHYFDVRNTVGMSTYLSGKNNLEDIIQETPFENLNVITSGPIPPNPSELILSYRLEELLNILKEQYDYIFIDSAPMGLVTDTMHLMQFSDLNLFVFRERYAKKSFITDLNTLILKHDLKRIGIILNAANFSSSRYGYGYGYGYGEDNKK